MKKLIALALLAAAVLLVTCRKAEHSTVSRGADMAAPVVMEKVATTMPAPPGAGQFAALRQETQRMIVRTADVRIVVADTEKAMAAIAREVERAGGFVSDSNIWREGELLRARLTLRVPSANLTATLATIRRASRRVEQETIKSEDVTQEYVDLGSQLRNLEATENELRALLVTVRQNARKASEILEVHQQLVAVRGEIERTKGRMQYLSQVTSLAAIQLDITPDAIGKPVVEAGWQPLVIVKDASRALIGALQSVATGAIWVVVYVLPMLGMFALIFFALFRAWRRSRTREA